MRGFGRDEFIRYRVPTLSREELASYHSTLDNVRLIERLNDQEHLWLLRDKGAFLKRFSHRMGREFIDLREASQQDFLDFVVQHSPCVAKPFDQANGAGIEVIVGPHSLEERLEMYQRFLDTQIYVIKSYIIQHEDVSRVYPHAVNSMRLTTLLTDGRAELVLPPAMRFGTGGCRIDMIGSIVALVDRENGDCLAGMLDKQRSWITHHPDTGVDMTAVIVPFLDEAVDLVLSCAKEIPEVRYVGWDVAITPQGPVLIEGNGAPGVIHIQPIQMKLKGEGFRRRLAALS